MTSRLFGIIPTEITATATQPPSSSAAACHAVATFSIVKCKHTTGGSKKMGKESTPKRKRGTEDDKLLSEESVQNQTKNCREDCSTVAWGWESSQHPTGSPTRCIQRHAE